MRIHPTLEYSAWVCLDNVGWVDVDVQTENKGSICSLEFRGGGTPLRNLWCPRRGRSRIPARQMSFVGPIRKRREWVRELGDRSCLSDVLFGRLAYWAGAGGRRVRAGIVALRGRVKVGAVACGLP